LYLILPDHPSDVYLVKECEKRLVSVNWNPGNGNQLLVASSTKISVFTPSVENVVNMLDVSHEFDTKPLLLSRWVHVPTKYKVENPNTNVWNESFSFGRKFSPDRPSPTQSSFCKSSFLALSTDGIVYWGYLSANSTKWNLLSGALRGFSQALFTTAESTSQSSSTPTYMPTYSHNAIIKADFFFSSYTSARIALVTSSAPSSVSVYDVDVDFKTGTLNASRRPTSILKIPSAPSAAVDFFSYEGGSQRSHSRFSTLHRKMKQNETLWQNDKYSAGSAFPSPRSGANAASNSSFQGSNAMPAGMSHPPMTPKTPGESFGGNSGATHPKEDAPVWSTIQVDHEPVNAIQHLSWDPYDGCTLYLVWHKFRRSQNGFERCSFLQRWRAQTHSMKVKCGVDISKYTVSAEAEELHTMTHTSEHPVPANDGFNTSVADFDDMDVDTQLEGADYNDLWEFEDSKGGHSNGPTSMGLFDSSNDSKRAQDPSLTQSSASLAFQSPQSNTKPSNGSLSSNATLRTTNLVMETWECAARAVILANTQMLNHKNRTDANLSTSARFSSHADSTQETAFLASSSTDNVSSRGTRMSGEGHDMKSSNPGPNATSSSSNESSAYPLGGTTGANSSLRFDTVTHLRIGRNIVCMTMMSGSTLVLDAETLDIVVDYSIPHTWSDSGATMGPGAVSSSVPVAPTSMTSSQGLLKANPKKRSIDAVQHSPGAPWGLELPFSPQTGFSAYDHFLSPSPTGSTNFGSAATSLEPPSKRNKRSESTSMEVNSVHVLRASSARDSAQSGYTTVASSNAPIAGCISPNQACYAVLFEDMSVRVFHLAPLLRYRTTVLTAQQLCIQVVNMFEVAMLRRCTFWDVTAMFLALPEDGHAYHEQHLHRGVILLLARDIERLEPRSNMNIGWWRTNLELIKSAIYRSSPDMAHNFMRSQSILSLKRINMQLGLIYRCAPFFRKLLESPTLDHPEIALIFSKTHDFTNDKTRLEKEPVATTSPLYALKWVQAFTQWTLSTIDAFQKKLARYKQQVSEQNRESGSSGPSSFIADESSYMTNSQQTSTQGSGAGMHGSGSVVATPSGSMQMSATPTSIATPGASIATPMGAIVTPGSGMTAVSTPSGGVRMFESPHGGSVPNSAGGTPAPAVPRVAARGAALSVLLSLPDWYSRLPIMPESLEELLMILPDSNVNLGLLWALDASLLTLLKESLLYFAVAIHLDNVHPNGKEYLRQFPQPYFATFHHLLTGPSMTLAHASTKYITEDWIADQALPTLYSMTEVHTRNIIPDISPLDLTPPRQRFLEFNFFPGSPVDPQLFPLRDGKAFTDSSLQNEQHNENLSTPRQFWHTSTSAPPPHSTPDTVSLSEVKGEYCKKCTLCNRISSLAPKLALDGIALFTNACPICHAPWMVIRNPHALPNPTKRAPATR
jgi:hypothetical protein